MARELQDLEIGNSPELLRVAEEVRATGRSCLLKRGAEEIAVVAPVETPPGTGRKKDARTAQPNAWLDGLVGIASSEGPSDVSANKHKYLAEAHYAESHDSHEG